MTTAPFWKTPRSCALLSSWRHDGQDRPDKETTKFTPPPPPWWPYDARRKQSKCIHFLDFLYFPIYSRRNYSVGTNTSFSWFQVIHFKPLTFLKNCCSKSLSTFECWVSFLDLESIKVPNHPFRMDGLALLCWQGMIHFHSGILLSA